MLCPLLSLNRCSDLHDLATDAIVMTFHEGVGLSMWRLYADLGYIRERGHYECELVRYLSAREPDHGKRVMTFSLQRQLQRHLPVLCGSTGSTAIKCTQQTL